jgi:hypothetical protein
MEKSAANVMQGDEISFDIRGRLECHHSMLNRLGAEIVYDDVPNVDIQRHGVTESVAASDHHMLNL